MTKLKCLAALLFHNDEDIVDDHIMHYLNNNHDLIVFNHNSDDATHEKILKFIPHIRAYYYMSKDVIFMDNEVHVGVSNVLMGNPVPSAKFQVWNVEMETWESFKSSDQHNYRPEYDWISFPESDEFLEGPDRSKTYYEHLVDLHEDKSKNCIEFMNFVFWFTDVDDDTIESPIERVRYYSWFKNCGPRMYAWRAHLTNVRWFGHNLPLHTTDKQVAKGWKTRHYDGRSKCRYYKKLIDRSTTPNPSNQPYNVHYKNRANRIGQPVTKELEYDPVLVAPFEIDHRQLYYDNGVDDLIPDAIFDWREKHY